MKNIFTCLLALCLCAAYGQQDATNMVLLDQLQYDVAGNDVWGYIAPDGTEYALMGLRDRTSIVSLADPANIIEIATVYGTPSIWRDLKTWNNYAYVSNDNGGDLAIIDLSNLPNGVTSTEFYPMFGNQVVERIHNIYVDEMGFLYIAGSNLNNGGVIIYDLNQDGGNPVLAGVANNQYAHDVYTRDNIMYTSDINAAVFTIHDVTDKSNIQVLSAQSTPFFKTHNAWLSDDGNTIFTTDELANAPTAAYDISDFNDIKKLDEFRPPTTVGLGVIPHNAHVLNDFLVVSHYTDGVVIVDANRPGNMIEVGNYDTYGGPDGGFSGCWGAFPFFPSGIVLASNLEGRLDVLMPNYVRACYLEGRITDADTGLPIFDANTQIVSTNTRADMFGDYKTGYVTPGQYDVEYSHPEYLSQTVNVAMATNETTIQDVALAARLPYVFSGQVVDAANNTGVEGAVVSMKGVSGEHVLTTDASGNFTGTVLEDTYEIYVGRWGYHTKLLVGQEVGGPTTTTIPIDKGIKDEFAMDLGWTVSSTAPRGIWERGEPIGTTANNGNLMNPDLDLANDLGNQCYVTGNGGGSPGQDDVDNGTTTLISPTMDLTTMVDPYITYYTWFVNSGGQSDADDRMEVILSDGNTEAIVETIDGSLSQWRSQSTIRVKDYFENPTPNMQVSFETGDYNEQHLVEAAVDLFEVLDLFIGVENVIDENIQLVASPNPFNEELVINYSLENVDENTRLEIRNTLGQIVHNTPVSNTQGTYTVNEKLDAGIYFIQITKGQTISKPVKVVCTK